MARMETKKKPESVLENWMNANFETSRYRPNYTQAKEHVGKLLVLAASARKELEDNLSKISSKREDVKKNYNIYKSALEKTIMHMEDTISQMEMLKSKFFAAHPGQKAEYEKRLSILKTRLAELEQNAKWLPRQLQGHRFKRIDDVVNAEIASLSPKGAVPQKSRKEQLHEIKKIDEMILTETDVAELEKAGKREKNAQKKEPVMVFTENEVPQFREAEEKETRRKEKAQMLDAFNMARKYGKEMAKLRKEGKPTGAIARKRFEAYAEYIALGGDLGKVPMNVAKALYKEGKLV